jgi:hypothetical protein
MISIWTHPSVRADQIYLTDNGRPLCGSHLGAAAATTMRDISGQPIYAVTPNDVLVHGAIKCEVCGRAFHSMLELES